MCVRACLCVCVCVCVCEYIMCNACPLMCGLVHSYTECGPQAHIVREPGGRFLGGGGVHGRSPGLPDY